MYLQDGDGDAEIPCPPAAQRPGLSLVQVCWSLGPSADPALQPPKQAAWVARAKFIDRDMFGFAEPSEILAAVQVNFSDFYG